MSSKARQFADQVSNLITISSGGSDFVTPDILSASVTAASAAAVGYTDNELQNIDLTSTIITASSAAIDELDNRIIISSASPTLGNDNGRVWINNTTASAPLVSVYGNNTWRMPGLGSDFTATGGNTVTTVGNYRVHTFTSSGTFSVTASSTSKNIEVLLVGGGGGTCSYAGGGGGGEVVHVTSHNVPAGNYPITIGAGGNGETGNNGFNINRHGTSTTALGQTALPGGGGKGSDDTTPPGNGTITSVANGGGGSSRSYGYFGTIGSFQGGASGIRYGGNRGGQVSGTNQAPNYPGAGGGGAGGSISTNSGTTNGSTGGNGVQVNFNGVNYYWGGGGGGGTYYSGAGGNGGLGGGGGGSGGGSGGGGGASGITNGDNATTTLGGNGGANTGGGGGAGRGELNGKAGNGGSGIVIIRYLT